MIPLGPGAIGADDYALDAELARLEKLRRIATLQNEVAGLGLAHNPISHVRRNEEVAFVDVQCAIAPFSGDDAYKVANWVANYDRLMDTLGASLNSRLLCARRLLCGSVAMLMRSVSAESWYELRDQLIF